MRMTGLGLGILASRLGGKTRAHAAGRTREPGWADAEVYRDGGGRANVADVGKGKEGRRLSFRTCECGARAASPVTPQAIPGIRGPARSDIREQCVREKAGAGPLRPASAERGPRPRIPFHMQHLLSCPGILASRLGGKTRAHAAGWRESRGGQKGSGLAADIFFKQSERCNAWSAALNMDITGYYTRAGKEQDLTPSSRAGRRRGPLPSPPSASP